LETIDELAAFLARIMQGATPAGRVVPVLGRFGGLSADADIGLRQWPCAVRPIERYPRRRIGWIDTEDITRDAVQSDDAVIARTADAILVIGEEAAELCVRHFRGDLKPTKQVDVERAMQLGAKEGDRRLLSQHKRRSA
jgi:hypothetical protein